MSGPVDDNGLRAELERLRRENAALDEQVKLLVTTEQRLYRIQNELDTQLLLLRALATFSLGSSVDEAPGATLARALDLVATQLSLDWVGLVRPGAGARDVELVGAAGRADGPAAAVETDAEVRAWLDSRPAPLACSLDPAAPAACWRLIDAVAPGLVDGAGASFVRTLACVPIHGSGESPPGVLVGVCLRPRPDRALGGGLGERHLPFLVLVAEHVDHALANAHLARRLQERGAELAQSFERLERTQMELLQAQKLEAIGRLAGGVAHDFNNLLTVILGYSGTLAVTLGPESPAQENVGKVIAAAQRAANLTRQLLALGRRQVQRRERFDLGDQCARTVELLRRLVGENIHVELELDPDLAPVHADRTQVEQVLLNLIVNARDAMPAGGELHIATRPAFPSDLPPGEETADAADFAALVVRDEGVGMDADTLARAFDPFFSTKPSGQGTGLGLSVVYGIVKQSGGHVLAESEPGRGACFTVLLPLAATRAAAVAELGTPGDDLEPQPPEASILVAEDEHAIREVVQAALARAGYDVRLAADGIEALEMLRARVPDLVLTDVLMPRMGGQALAAEIARAHPGVRVAFMSGYAADFGDGDDAAERHGAFLQKPFTSDELRVFVARQLAREGTRSAAR